MFYWCKFIKALPSFLIFYYIFSTEECIRIFRKLCNIDIFIFFTYLFIQNIDNSLA